MKRVAVIGGGAWGTALALVAARAGAGVVLWARDSAIITAINDRHGNPVYLPGIALDPAIGATSEPEAALNHAEAALLVVPAQFMRGVLGLLQRLLPPGMPLLLCAKGIEIESLQTISELAHELAPGSPLAVLSGPSLAGEVARDLPTAKLGPERTASGEPGASSWASSEMVCNDSISMPLAQSNSGMPGGSSRWSRPRTPRMNCAGTTRRAASAWFSAASSSLVAPIVGSSAMPGR